MVNTGLITNVYWVLKKWLLNTITYTLMLFCNDGKAWMSDKLAEVNRGASSGNRLPSFTRWVWNSTDIIVDR